MSPAWLCSARSCTDIVLTPPPLTVKVTPLLAIPFTVTTTFPVVAPEGTDVTMLVALQLVTAAGVPLKVTVLVPCADPKFVPVIVTAVPTGPESSTSWISSAPPVRCM